MDNFTHSLAGWALGQAGLKTTTRKGLAALILGANMPDIDVFFGSVPWEPLAMHRGFTHGVLGIVLSAPLLFGLLLGLDRWQVARGARFNSGLELHPLRLLGLCYLGALTHPLLDLQTTYSVQLLSPFSGAWFHADSLFIIDVWLWSLLSLAIAWSRGREKVGREWRRVPQLAVGAALAYIAFNLGLTQTARERVLLAAPDATAIFASPDPILSWRREMVWRQGDCYRRARFTIRAGLGEVSACAPSGMDHPLVHDARDADSALRHFLGWSVLPQAYVERGRCSARVLVSDARYGDRRNSRLSHETRLALPC
ncbi:metal-dependent hydrolase [Sphingomonas mesophila]|uniref:metal-dependent hydrolase n=1 Tax=Sphingomonas mesophila TaxID=2303576 RepID=UPI000E56F9A2|nr:metal-dependent hydrolase [Sphingomonas mesophila]